MVLQNVHETPNYYVIFMERGQVKSEILTKSTASLDAEVAAEKELEDKDLEKVLDEQLQRKRVSGSSIKDNGKDEKQV